MTRKHLQRRLCNTYTHNRTSITTSLQNQIGLHFDHEWQLLLSVLALTLIQLTDSWLRDNLRSSKAATFVFFSYFSLLLRATSSTACLRALELSFLRTFSQVISRTWGVLMHDWDRWADGTDLFRNQQAVWSTYWTLTLIFQERFYNHGRGHIA